MTRSVFRPPIAVAPIAAAMILIAVARLCHATSDVFAVVEKSGAIVPGKAVLTLWVPGGKYAIFAKINLDQDDTSSGARLVCTLKAGAVEDLNIVRLQASSEKALDNTAVAFQGVHEFGLGSVSDITVTCRFPPDDSSTLSFRFAKLMAIRLDGTLCEEHVLAICP
jgi:hypothetical protein